MGKVTPQQNATKASNVICSKRNGDESNPKEADFMAVLTALQHFKLPVQRQYTVEFTFCGRSATRVVQKACT